MGIITQYTIYCTKDQTKKALELGAGISWCEKERKTNDPTMYEKGKGYKYFIPTAEQMIGWLETQGKFKVIAINNSKNLDWSFHITTKNKEVFASIGYKSRKKATLTAIDEALKYLEQSIK